MQLNSLSLCMHDAQYKIVTLIWSLSSSSSITHPTQPLSLSLFVSAGHDLFDVEDGREEGPSGEATVHFTLIFNIFVMMQIFNEINSRKVHGERQVFSGIFTNPIFVAVIVGTFVVQVSEGAV